MNQPPAIRRVVTGHDANGRSIIEADGIAPQRYDSPDVPGFGATVAWWTDAEIDHAAPDTASGRGAIPMSPTPGGSIFRIADFPPDTAYSPEAIRSMFHKIGGAHEQANGVAHGDSRHFWFHRTNSLDYAIVLSGEITLLMDEGESTLGPGDVVVQRATNHAWSNRSKQSCRMLFVLLGTAAATPSEIAARRTQQAVEVSGS